MQPKVIKLIIIGDSEVGKSCLLLRYTDNVFMNSYISTVGIDYKVKKVVYNNQPFTVSCWDSSGSEKFKSILPSYYRGCHGVILAVDITDRESFKKVSYWLSQIDLYAPTNIIKVLVVTKCDLSVSQHKIQHSEVVALSKEFSLPFFLTSSKTGAQVEEAFQNLIQQIEERNLASEKLKSVLLHSNKKKDTKCSACMK